MKKLAYLLALLTATACSNDDNEVQIDNRTPITFSATAGTEVVASPITKALATPTVDGFDNETRIVMLIKSHDSSQSQNSDKYTITVAKAAAKNNNISFVSFESEYKRYWDDAHGRNSELSVYAVAVENQSDSNVLPNNCLGTNVPASWSESSINYTISWDVEKVQSLTSLNQDNLVYSNNIQTGGEGGRKLLISNTTDNGPLQFEPDNTGTGHGKFNQGHMKFNHALTKITVNLTAGTGFQNSFSDVTGTIVGTIKNAPYSGTLDLSTGKWEDNPTKNNVQMATSSDKTSHTALILPGTEIADNGSTDIIDFTVSATIVGWSQVTVDNVEPSNAYITLSLYIPSNPTDKPCDDFDLYRLPENGDPISSSGSNPQNLTKWSGDYGQAATLQETSNGSNKYTTNWYFESNTIYYHFRTVKKDVMLSTVNGNSTFTIQSGFNGEGLDTAYDPHWGAPMKSDPTVADAYSLDNGFESCLHSAIGATTSNITITELHMLSNVFVQLKSDNNSGDQNQLVNLTGATVEFFNLGNQATVDMGSGKIEAPTSVDKTTTLKLTTVQDNYFSPIVPQSLNRGGNKTDKVGIKIKAADGNVYQVDDISQYKISGEDTKVDRWYPNHKYTYTFNLLKTGIKTVTCTVTNWQNVDVNGGNVTIE